MTHILRLIARYLDHRADRSHARQQAIAAAEARLARDRERWL